MSIVSIGGHDCTVRTRGYGPFQFKFDRTATQDIEYFCDWNVAIEVCAALLGYPAPPTYVGEPREPHAHPEISALKCINAVRHPFKKPTTSPNAYPRWEGARIVATYGIPEFGGFGGPEKPEKENPFGPWAEESRDVAGEFITVPGKTFLYLYDVVNNVIPRRVIAQDIGKLVIVSERTYTIKNVISVNYDALEAATGSLNIANWPLASGPNSAPRGTMQFLGYATRKPFGSQQFKPAELLLKFRKRIYDWNYIFAPDSVEQDSNGNIVYWQEVIPNPYEYALFETVFGNDNIQVRL